MAHAQAYENAYDDDATSQEGPSQRRAVALENEPRAARSNIRKLFEDSEEEDEFDLGAETETKTGSNWKSESQRVIDEVSELMRRFEAATSGAPNSSRSARRAAPRPQERRTPLADFREPPAREHRSAPVEEPCSCGAPAGQASAAPQLKPDFYKRMFMFMMNELA